MLYFAMRRQKNVLPLTAVFLLIGIVIALAFYFKDVYRIKDKKTFSLQVFPTPVTESTPDVKGKKVQSTNIITRKISQESSPIPSPSPTSKPSATPGTNMQDYIMRGINDYRASKGLSSVKIDGYTCNFASTRAGEISKGFNHDGFNGRVASKSLPYPSYSEVTENIAMNSDYKKVVAMWINSAGHAENMRRDTPNVCVVRSGNYFAYEGWRP